MRTFLRESRLPLALRELDPQEAGLRNLLLSAGVAGLSLVRPSAHQTYVTMAATMDEHECTVLAPLQSLLDFWMGEGVLPAALMDPEIAHGFLLDAFRDQGLPSPSPMLRWRAIGQPATRADLSRPYLCLTEGPFDLLLPCLPSDFGGDDSARWEQLPVELRWSLGVLTLRAAHWGALGPGDVVRLPDTPGRICAGEHILYGFRLDGDTLMTEVLPHDAPIDPAGDENPRHAAEVVAGVSLDALPVAVDFVLARRAMTVAEVSGLRVGMTLPLPKHMPHVDLMAGSMCVARGELVRLGQGLAVEILTVSPPVKDPSDACQARSRETGSPCDPGSDRRADSASGANPGAA